eukprot:1692410-Karenia_brevis.AAC.1
MNPVYSMKSSGKLLKTVKRAHVAQGLYKLSQHDTTLGQFEKEEEKRVAMGSHYNQSSHPAQLE